MPDDHALLHPLDELYARVGVALPVAERIDGEALPRPYRELLAHDGSMTVALERYHAHAIRLRVLAAYADGTTCLRQVALVLDGSDTAVAFGAAKIDLARFPPPLRAQILAAERPLGAIVCDDGAGAYLGPPAAFVRVASDGIINAALGLVRSQTLYGRRRTLFDAARRPAAEIVEILSSLPATRA
jgi:hypothetical protein